MINFDKIKTFEGGHSTSLLDNVERQNTFQKGINGRLYSHEGVLAFSAVKGSKLIYQNNQIVKYLGYYSFRDEVIIFAKCLKSAANPPIEEEVCEKIISSDSFTISIDTLAGGIINVVSEITDNSLETENCHTVTIPPVNNTNFETQFSCDEASGLSIDFGEYYGTYLSVPLFSTCDLNLNQTPINNEDYYDCIYSLRLDDNFNLVGTQLWVGSQNWPMNGKITCDGVEENEFYKRVYYTDAFNPRRVVNIKDTSLINRSADEFNQILNNTLLQPEIKEITSGGQLKSMKALYVYRMISENGQLSEFSPSSFYAQILPEDLPIKYRGGDVSEVTGKTVKITCNIIEPETSAEIECVALEFEAFGPPTSIRNLGRKPASDIVEFQHFGNEEEFSDDITFNDIIDFKNTWKYCNDFSSKKNKLIAGGLRNEPIPTSINNLSYLFPLHAWDSLGASHDCLMNPRPWDYRYIDPSNEDPLIYVKQKVYRSISSFGPLTLKFKNIAVPNEIQITFNDLTLDNYSDITSLVLAWLLDEKANNPNFDVYFPNLTITDETNQILLSPTNDLIETDMANYVFESNNSQFIENFDNDIVFLTVAVDTDNLVYGGQSIGYHLGTGIRVTYREFKEPLLNQAAAIYDGTGKILDYEKPSEEKYCMKGEIYRIAFQAYNNDSTRYFAVPLGDLMIPNIGDVKTSIDDSGNAIITSQKYTNQSIENGILYGHGIKMHIEVRLSCELQKEIPMYQILYVERTEDNRTILCQGIAAPLTRVQTNGSGNHVMPEEVTNKWNLPFNGGPTYEKLGLDAFDAHGENDQYIGDAGGAEGYRRTMTHRSLMYFDSPDLYYNKVSDQYLESSKISVIGKLNTDHTPGIIREHGGTFGGANFGDEIYPKFSRKILEDQLEGNNHTDALPRDAIEERESGTYETHFVNVSVFANFQHENNEFSIDIARSLSRGEVISGSALNVDNDVSNNTFALSCQPWYYGLYQRDWKSQDGRANSEIFDGAVISPGYKTAIIKTATNLFTDTFIGPAIHTVSPEIRLGGDNHIVYDTIPLINIYRNNRESVYGGRTEESFSRNTYIPLSKTIPTLKSSNGTQFFDIGADVYISLNIRTKNDYGDDELFQRSYNNGGGARAKGDIDAWQRNSAWAYVAVLETQVEPKLTYQYEFYKESGTHSFDATRGDIINQAYFNENTLKQYIPKPFKFRDDPNRGHVVAVSDVKLAGEYYDSWTVFKVNNYYSLLEKNKGDISNLLKQEDILFVIQEDQTSRIYIGENRIITDKEGSPVIVQQGTGSVVDGHKTISPYGTSIRRAGVESDYGFCFFDEKNIEFIKIDKPLLTQNLLHIEYFNLFKSNPIIDSEAFFDYENKETNIRLRTKDGTSYTISYNEILKVFNGQIEYDNDLYIMFDKKTFHPINTGSLSEDLHQLNEGKILNISGELKTMTLGFYINAQIDKVFQYKIWGAVSNIDFPFKSIRFKSSLGQDRTILGAHNAYQLREGNHSVPAINETNDQSQCDDIRGNWVYVEMVIELPQDKLDIEKVNILAVINSLRFSHQ